jgi:hypothetical protein
MAHNSGGNMVVTHARSKSMDVAVSLRGMLIEPQQRPTLA